MTTDNLSAQLAALENRLKKATQQIAEVEAVNASEAALLNQLIGQDNAKALVSAYKIAQHNGTIAALSLAKLSIEGDIQAVQASQRLANVVPYKSPVTGGTGRPPQMAQGLVSPLRFG